MAVYIVEQYEIHSKSYRVEADSEAGAMALLFAGAGEPLEGGLDFIDIDKSRGLPVRQFPELAEALRAAGEEVIDVIPSIRDITLLE